MHSQESQVLYFFNFRLPRSEMYANQFAKMAWRTFNASTSIHLQGTKFIAVKICTTPWSDFHTNVDLC